MRFVDAGPVADPTLRSDPDEPVRLITAIVRNAGKACVAVTDSAPPPSPNPAVTWIWRASQRSTPPPG